MQAQDTCTSPGCACKQLPNPTITLCRRCYRFRDGAQLPDPCAIEGCDKLAVGRGYCKRHYARWRRHGDPMVGGHKRYTEDGQRRCTRCGEAKGPEEFHRFAQMKDGLGNWCKTCTSDHSKITYYADVEASRAKARAWYYANYEVASETNRRNSRVQWQKRRAAKFDAPFYEEVNRAVLFARDGGICGICGKSVDPEQFHVDHVVPLSRGGPHNYANTQVAHPRCNLVKGARMAA